MNIGLIGLPCEVQSLGGFTSSKLVERIPAWARNCTYLNKQTASRSVDWYLPEGVPVGTQIEINLIPKDSNTSIYFSLFAHDGALVVPTTGDIGCVKATLVNITPNGFYDWSAEYQSGATSYKYALYDRGTTLVRGLGYADVPLSFGGGTYLFADFTRLGKTELYATLCSCTGLGTSSEGVYIAVMRMDAGATPTLASAQIYSNSAFAMSTTLSNITLLSETATGAVFAFNYARSSGGDWRTVVVSVDDYGSYQAPGVSYTDTLLCAGYGTTSGNVYAGQPHLVALSGTSLVAVYNQAGATQNVCAVAGTVSGTTVTYGAPLQIASNASGQGYAIHKVSGTVAFATYYNASHSGNSHCCVSVSGSSVTAGAVVNSNASNGYGAVVCMNDTGTRGVMLYQSASAGVRGFSISGTTITLGTAYADTNGYRVGNAICIATDTDGVDTYCFAFSDATYCAGSVTVDASTLAIGLNVNASYGGAFKPVIFNGLLVTAPAAYSKQVYAVSHKTGQVQSLASPSYHTFASAYVSFPERYGSILIALPKNQSGGPVYLARMGIGGRLSI